MIKLIYVMKEGKVTLLSILIFILAINTSHSQNTVYSTIAKNIHSTANSLQHNLNRSGDTLHLSSDFNLYKVEFIGAYEAKVFEVDREKKQISIPLNSVPVGEYTIAAFQIEKTEGIYQEQKTIIFRISRLLPIEDFKDEELITEAKPEIIEEEPIIKEEEAVVAEVVKEEPAKKKRVKKERVKKNKAKKEVEKENKIRVVKTRVPRPKKEKTVRPEKTKKEVVETEVVEIEVVEKETVKKETVKKAIVKEKETRVATRATKSENEKEIVEAIKPIIEKTITSIKPEKEAGVVERKEPSLDATEYKAYNLTNSRNGSFAVQSREEYRAENLRPNGEAYN